MATPVFRYPLDPTGNNPDNLVVREPKALSPKTNPTDVRVTCPLYGPFYAESLVILDAANGRALAKNEYKTTDLLQDPTLEFGQEISQFIVITNGAVSNNIEISYQVLGGNYQNDSTAVQHVFETFLNDTRPVDWSNVTDKPATFPPSLHVHLLQDIVNFGPLVVAIDSLRQALLLNNTPMFEALIDFVLSRKYGWNDVIDKPTTVQGYGITNAVTTNTNQTVTGVKTFSKVILGTGSTAQNPDATGSDLIATDGQVKRAEARLVPKTTQVLAGTGLAGGGQLKNDVTLALAPSGVSAGTFGSTTRIPVMAVDQFGRITQVSNVEPNLAWDRITDKPTTADGFGLTDVVKTTGDQLVRGKKDFENIIARLGSQAANIHNGAFSKIVSEDFLKYFMANEFSKPPVGGVTSMNLGTMTVQYGVGGNETWITRSTIGTTRNLTVAKLAVPLHWSLGLIFGMQDKGIPYLFAPVYGAPASNNRVTPTLQPQGSSPTNYFTTYTRVYVDGGDDGGSDFYQDAFSSVSGFWVVFGIPW